METLINCTNCKTNLLIVEDKLFYSSEESETNISCPICNKTIETKQTDGWFFVQTESEYEKEKEIEKKKERLIYPIA
jgi:ssDNA-binding Zn-finger/Zn-ribbon topoisomerase 1